MKKALKVIGLVFAIIVLLIALDILSIYAFKRPIFAVYDDVDSVDKKYMGLFYDTHVCFEKDKATIVLKNTKCACDCRDNKGYNVISITDLVEKNNEVCAEALEEIYVKDGYTYSLPCIKSERIIVQYENGEQENIREALKNTHIHIEDLEVFGILVYKEHTR